MTELDFQSIYDTYHGRITRYLERLVGKEEAEDLGQEVFLKINRGLKGFRGDSQLSTWIYRVATNAARDRLRRPSFKQAKLTEPWSGAVEAAAVNGGHAYVRPARADQDLIKKEMNQCIRNFIENLPEHYRTVLVLSELEGLKNREIADVLQISLGAVKIRLHRARAQLAKELENHCRFYRDDRNELACDLKQGIEEYRKDG